MAEKPKRYYPVYLDLAARLAIVVGGGEPALRKARQLLRYGADVTVIDAEPGEELLEAEAAGELTVEHRGYSRGDLAGAALAVCVSRDPEIRGAVRSEAESVGCLLNVVDAPEMCSFIVPSVVNREPLQISVSTGGLAPGLTKQIRREIAAQYGPEWGEYARILGDARAIAYQLIPDAEDRSAALAAVADSDLLERLKAGESPTAAELMSPYVPNPTPPAEDS